MQIRQDIQISGMKTLSDQTSVSQGNDLTDYLYNPYDNLTTFSASLGNVIT
jgi:hypothetical protein